MFSTRRIAILSFVFTALFFIEYTPLARRVHIPFDLEEFHYPLADYAYQAIHQGRFPQWDPTIYSGLSFVGNTQAALFYPPTWLMFALNGTRAQLSYQAVEDLALAHVWLAFLLCYLWLHRQLRLHPLAAALGAGVFAFSGYMLLQLQHLGLIAGYAWMPLGFSAIDESDQRRGWRPLWKLAVASALCFLAGYPTTWLVFAICMIAYAGARSGGFRLTSLAACALAGSLAIAAIQALPAWEASRLKVPDPKYDRQSGTKDPEFFLSYVAPNYFDFDMSVPVGANPGREYLYLGCGAFAGLALLAARRRLTGLGPPLAVLVVSFLLVTNPFGALGWMIEKSSLLEQLFSAWYFLAGLTAAVAPLAAIGLDSYFRRASEPAPLWIATVSIALSLAWSIRLLSGAKLAAGWWSALDALVALILAGALIYFFPRSTPRLRVWTAMAILILTAAEYRAYGVAKRFNAARGPYSAEYVSEPFPNLNAGVYQRMRAHPEYRVALDLTAPFPQKLRHSGLTTPQGFDPFLPAHYKTLIDRLGRFRTNREFDLSSENEDALRLLGVRYLISTKGGPLYSRLASNPRFRLLQPDDSYYQAFEFLDAWPSFGWEEPRPDRKAELRVWRPETRALDVRSPSGGRFRLGEQAFPGWHATIDGVEAPIERCHEAFQCVEVLAGEHTLEFHYRSRLLIIGAIVSLCAVSLMVKELMA